MRDILLAEFDYDELILNIEYGNSHQVIGEVDVLAIKDYYDFYEVKCRETNKLFNKAREQYQRFKHFYGNRVRNGYFYAGGDIIQIR